jgi:phospholipid/cholesterol/gamma-HCH transport system substrate-binding protein
MASSRSFEIGTGLFILLGFAALAFLATQTTSLAGYRQGDTYGLTARFTNIGQLKDRAPVKLAGVTIGSVRTITLDGTALDAVVTIDIDTKFNEIPDDSSLSIYTSGLLGDQYVAIKPGGSPDFMADGGEFVLTESSVQLEELIGKYLVGGEGGRANGGQPAGSDAPDPQN